MTKITPKVVAGRVYVFMFLSQKLHQRLWLAGSTCSREDGRSGDLQLLPHHRHHCHHRHCCRGCHHINIINVFSIVADPTSYRITSGSNDGVIIMVTSSIIIQHQCTSVYTGATDGVKYEPSANPRTCSNHWSA